MKQRIYYSLYSIVLKIYIYNGLRDDTINVEHLRDITGSAFDHRSLPPEFEPRRGHI